MSVSYELAVWTSSSPAYAQGVVQQLFNEAVAPAFVWASDRCTRRFDAEFYRHISSKNLSKLKRRGYRLEQVLMVDDSPEKLSRHYGNLVQIAAYDGAMEDRELDLLGRYLLRIADHANVRRLEKRGWRQQVSGE